MPLIVPSVSHSTNVTTVPHPSENATELTGVKEDMLAVGCVRPCCQIRAAVFLYSPMIATAKTADKSAGR